VGMPFVDLFRFKRIRRITTMSQKNSEKVRQKKRENISKKSAEKNPLNLWGKIPESRVKLPGFSNPKNIRTLFSE
jgi:hypothetical protein